MAMESNAFNSPLPRCKINPSPSPVFFSAEEEKEEEEEDTVALRLLCLR